MKGEFTDLVLIIGTSPLPNYVVAKYFVDTNNSLERIWFVHSDSNSNQSSTRMYAENIELLLLKKCNNINANMFKYVPIKNIENMQEINNTLASLIQFESDSKVHLNFTGGTKVMVVQAYNFINNLEEIEEKNFSYLSSRTFDLRDGNQNIICKDLRPFIVTSIEDLISLHNYERANELDNFDFSEATKLFSQLITRNKLDSYYNNKIAWNRGIFLVKKGNLAKNYAALNLDLIKREQPRSKQFLDIIKAMPKELRIYDGHGIFVKPETDKNLETALGYLDGKWLEEYVYQTLKEHLKDHNNIYIDKNWEIKDPNWMNNKFEIDVIMIKGYQLFGISCTTLGGSNKAAIKNKGFEIILRSRQMGGDEAKAILITRADEQLRKLIEDELKTETGAKENILVLGNTDIEHSRLTKKISDFIK